MFGRQVTGVVIRGRCWQVHFLTVACCFSALSVASSSCFCKAAWRDFISSLQWRGGEKYSFSTYRTASLSLLQCQGTKAPISWTVWILTKQNNCQSFFFFFLQNCVLNLPHCGLNCFLLSDKELDIQANLLNSVFSSQIIFVLTLTNSYNSYLTNSVFVWQ